MNIFLEADLSEKSLSLGAGPNNPKEEKKIHIPQAISKNPEAKLIFEEWISDQKNPDVAKSFFQKISKLSLKPQTLLSAILFLQYQKTEYLPKKNKNLETNESGKLFLESIVLYKRMLKVNQFPKRPKNQKQIELTLRMFLTVLADIQLLTVFLVLQLHKLEQIKMFPQEKKNEIAWIALNIHAPLAGRLGIFWIKSELEDLAFRQLEYENYQILKRKIARKSSARSESVNKILSKIQFILKQAGIAHKVSGRYKRFYSIFQKLEKVDNDFDRIQDLIAFRVVVNDVDDCYAALSFIHENWLPIENRFKDYIVNPKSNGYQSIHTTVKSFQDDGIESSKPIEIQIRTKEMHQRAEYGVAAHWLYKEKQQKKIKKTSQKIEGSLSEKTRKHYIDGTIPMIDLFRENIYVMTPAKEIKELPKVSTPIDFAYAIHTAIGNKTTGAKSNGKIARLDSNLYSGDIVEILTSPRQKPKKEWLKFAKTRHARNKIKHALHEQTREIKRKEGFEILDRDFRIHGLNLNKLIRDGKIEKESRHNKNQEFEHILFCIGEGSIKSEEVRKWFIGSPENLYEDKTSEFLKQNKNIAPPKHKVIISTSGNEVLVDGMKSVTTRIAKCCNPIKEQRIQGYITKEKIITIHKEKCTFLLKLNPERIINANWIKKII